jgi:hypothetical protein
MGGDVSGGSSGADIPRSALGDPGALHIFICYRREDTAANAGRLADALVERFGRHSVFMDVDTIEPGVDFNEEIDRAIGHCDVLIALIGPRWLESSNARGRRLDDPQDYVRLEIGHALDRGIRVIPTLVGGAEMPEADVLPGDLAKLAKRNAVELTDKRFRTDLQALVEPLERIAEQKRNRELAAAALVAPAPTVYLAPIATPEQQRSAPLQPLTTDIQRVATGNKRAPSSPLKARTVLRLGAVLVAAALVLAGVGVFAKNRLNANTDAAKPVNLLSLPAAYPGTWRGSVHEISPSADFAIIMTMSAGNIGSKVGHIDRPSLGGSCQQDLILDKATTKSITMTESGSYCGNVASGTKIVASLNGASMDWNEYQTDPSAGNPIAAATLSQASSGSIPGTSNLLALPDAYVGTWKGSVHEITPPADFAIVMTLQAGQIGSKIGHIDRPSLGGSCQQDLILDKATTQSITMTESGSYCGNVASGTKIVASLSGASMDWNEFQTDPSAGNPIATAALSKTS